MACISMGLHPNHVIYGLFCREEAELQIISPLLSIILTYTCAVLNAMKNNKTLQRFCGSLYTDRGILGDLRRYDPTPYIHLCYWLSVTLCGSPGAVHDLCDASGMYFQSYVFMLWLTYVLLMLSRTLAIMPTKISAGRM